MIEATDTADMMLPAATQLATDAIDPTEPMLPTESTEPMLPMDRIDPLEPMERIDEVDLTDRYERPDSASEGDDGLMHLLGVGRVGRNVSERDVASRFPSCVALPDTRATSS